MPYDGWAALDLPGWHEAPEAAWPAPVIPLPWVDLALDEGEPIVLVDMDGVLCDFVGQAYRACGVPEFAIAALESQITEWGDVHEPLGLTRDEMWGHIDTMGEDFWGYMPWRETGQDVIRRAEQMGTVYLASSPSRLPESRSGKYRWVQRELPDYAHRLILIKDKHLLAGANRVLIDDNPHNCQAFIDAGGQALLVPHHYNKKSTLKRLRFTDFMV